MKKTIMGLLAALLLLGGCGEGGGESSSVRTRESAVTEAESTAPTASGELSAEEVSAEPLTIKLTVPEGYTLPRIGMLLEEQGVCTAEEFLAAAQAYDVSTYPLASQQAENPNRCFKLEGYLFPDTYEIYRNEAPDAVIHRMLSHLEAKVDDSLRAAIADSGYTVDEIIALASIIEKESFGPEPMPMLSSILHNRLSTGMRLQCDVTITYVEGAIKPFIDGDKNRYNEYYNTYKCDGIPAGAICNPGIAAIQAAVYPAESDYFYFLTDRDNQYLYAATLEEHNANKAQAGMYEESVDGADSE